MRRRTRSRKADIIPHIVFCHEASRIEEFLFHGFSTSLKSLDTSLLSTSPPHVTCTPRPSPPHPTYLSVPCRAWASCTTTSLCRGGRCGVFGGWGWVFGVHAENSFHGPLVGWLAGLLR